MLTLRTGAEIGREVQSDHVAALRADEVITKPDHRLKLVPFDAVGATFSVHRSALLPKGTTEKNALTLPPKKVRA